MFNYELYSAAQVRELDRIVIEEFDIAGYELMQRAGRFSYETLKKTWSECNYIIVICGCGNNAGDGYVLAKLAIEDKKDVRVLNCFNPEKLKGDAKIAYQDLLTTNVKLLNSSDLMYEFTSDEWTGDREIPPLNSQTVFVDAIFGTGLSRDIDDDTLRKIIDEINWFGTHGAKVLSIDIPSGLNADTGSVKDFAVNADVTVTFMGIKKGMLTHHGCEYSGQIILDSLDIPPESYEILDEVKGGMFSSNCYDLHNDYSIPFHKRRRCNSHKGDFGHVLIVGGDEGYLGAAQMAAEAAMRVGSGLVSVATRKSHAAQLSITVPEIMCHGVETLDELMPLIKRANVIAIGPGLGQSEWAKLLFARVLESELPIIIDADGLNLLAEEEQSSENWVITPHPGEAARLLKTNVATIQTDRFQSARNLNLKYKGPVVLKGAGSIVTDSGGYLYVCTAGNPGMSTGGMGDVLTGVIAGLIAQGVDIKRATMAGVLMHARAADMSASSGERGMMATDLMPYLRELANPNPE